MPTIKCSGGCGRTQEVEPAMAKYGYLCAQCTRDVRERRPPGPPFASSKGRTESKGNGDSSGGCWLIVMAALTGLLLILGIVL